MQEAGHETTILAHPRVVRAVRFRNKAVEPRVVDAVWGFFAIYVFVFATLMVLVTVWTIWDPVKRWEATPSSKRHH